MNELSLTGFTKFYDKKSKTPACDNIDFFASAGEITGILGPNGAGKSTLLKTICGVHYVSSGNLLVCGKSKASEIRQVCAYVPENPLLNKNLTVKETLELEAALVCSDKVQIQKNVEEAVKITELGEVLKSKVSSLSKGFAQRTSLAKALCKNPDVLILDEFTAGLDPSQTAKIRSEIKKLAESKIIIFSTHHLEEAENLCSRLYVLNKGKVVSSGSVSEVISSCGCKTLEEAYINLTEKVSAK